MITIDNANKIANDYFSKKEWVVDSVKVSRKPDYFLINAAPKALYDSVNHDYSKVIGIPRYAINRNTKQIQQLSFYDLDF